MVTSSSRGWARVIVACATTITCSSLCGQARRVREDGRMEILSIQSSVAYGHVGNSSAVFPLQRLGIETWAVNTVHFSNHTGYGDWSGPLLSAEDLREVLRGVEARGVLARGA